MEGGLGNVSKMQQTLLSLPELVPRGRRQSERDISEDWGNWRGASTGDGRVVMWAKLEFAALRVGRG